MALIVQKFGGTVVAGTEHLRAAARRVAARRAAGDDVVVVVSAMGSETDDLLDLAGQISIAPAGRELDVLVTTGERKSIALLSMALQKAGCPARSFTGTSAGIRTDDAHSNARIVEVQVDALRASLERGEVPVVAGAQGLSLAGEETFLGRGGSDTTAVALAHALGADVCELYTDVDGVYTADPRVVTEAQRIAHLSYEEMVEMCAWGCPKPDGRAVELARAYGVKIHVRSAFEETEGSTIGPGSGPNEEKTMERWAVSSVSYDLSEAMVTVSGMPVGMSTATQLFQDLAESDINLDMIVKNRGIDDDLLKISFTTPKTTLDLAIKVCEISTTSFGTAKVSVRSDVGKISVVGAGLRSHPGVAAQMLRVLTDRGVDVEMISTSPIRMSCVVDEAATHGAVQALHEAFGLDAPPARPDET